MLIRNPARWELKESAATPETAYLNRRQIIKGLAGTIAAPPALGLISAGPAQAFALRPPEEEKPDGPVRAAMSAVRNPAYTIDRPLTPEDVNLSYNNFYEFGAHKGIAEAAMQDLTPRPWTVTIDGLVEKEIELDVDDLIARMGLEERLYRHRCVEAWSMTVPWIGFALNKLVEMARPLGSAKFLQMETFGDPEMGRGIRKQPWYPWAYKEGITMAEATNELPMLVVGAYGKQVAVQMGAPLRLHVPWKYGFKSIKSIVRFTFVEKRPVSFWTQLQANEYGFWANVNPDAPHPRWSQASERVLHTGERVPTLLFNGYAEEVAGLYSGIEGENLYL